MKKHYIIAIVLFILINVFSFASNFIRWDETPLEQTAFSLPLGIGLLLQMPFFRMMEVWIGDSTNPINYQLFWAIMPFITGAFYASIYCFFFFVVKRFQKRQPP